MLKGQKHRWQQWEELQFMLMKRRTPPTWFEVMRVSIWPRRSWLRSGQYVTKRILRLTATPHAVAAGVAAGAFTSFTPFLGLHFVIAAVLAWILRGNILASALGTFVGSPLTFPFIWAATYQTGNFVLYQNMTSGEAPAIVAAMKDVMQALYQFEGAAAMQALGNIWHPLLYPMTIGGVLLGPLLAIPVYMATRRAAVLFRESRRNKLMQKAAEIRDRAKHLAEQKNMPRGTESA